MEVSSQTSSSNRRPSRSDREEYFARRQSSLTVRREGEMCGRVPRLRLTLRRARIVGEAIAVVITVVAGLIGWSSGLALRPRSVARIRPARYGRHSRGCRPNGSPGAGSQALPSKATTTRVPICPPYW